MTVEQVSASHIGYLCDAPKVAVVRGLTSTRFTVENMAKMGAAPLGAARSSYLVVYEGEIERVDTLMGAFGRCDFSSVTTPGIYRVVLPESDARSFQFTIADGAYHRLPALFLDFIHELRSGYYADDLRGPLNLDDGVRSDNGQPWDASGGWYDAGDLRKWMTHSTLAALAFMDADEHLRTPRRLFAPATPYPNDLLAETAWGLDFIPKMQDPDSGMIYEDVGGGHTARFRPGMSWWYENHAGCYADNADNRFTDNLPGSGDERLVRIQYNPIAQYTNIAILARGYAATAPYDAALSRRCHDAALAAWAFCATRLDDEEHGWTAVRAWRLVAALELWRAGLDTCAPAEAALDALLANFDPALGFWTNAADSAEPYRGILHSAQPLVALAKYLDYAGDGAGAGRARDVLAACKRDYIDPITATNPYRFVPFGVYSAPNTDGDTFRPWRGRYVRFCMPVHHPQQINHGLAGHWMSWAHGLAYVGQVLGDSSWTALAWAQIEWLTGNNHVDVSFISGIGHNNPMPHSRFLGTLIGGFMNGFRGTPDDTPAVDMERDAEWNSTEYWNVPLANCLMALARLLPPVVATHRKLGRD
jgi:hypothetical protein